jgi:hypothetical protein
MSIFGAKDSTLERISRGRTDLVFDYVGEGHAATSKSGSRAPLRRRAPFPPPLKLRRDLAEALRAKAGTWLTRCRSLARHRPALSEIAGRPGRRPWQPPFVRPDAGVQLR